MASVTVPAEAGLAEVVTLGRQRPERGLGDDEERFFTDTLAEYQWARDVAGLAPSTLDRLTQPVIEVASTTGWRRGG